ncbi:MAG TPA: protein kinase [Polyangiaceae bacterium]|jgi:tetratricopeptide (TPR) repeat protein
MTARYEPGAIVASRFAIEDLAGEGGMGSVYRAHDRDRGERVALKIFHGKSSPKTSSGTEARTLLELAHPAIVRCVAFGTTEEGQDFLATEWLEGETLRQRLARGPIALAQVIRIARRVAEGLAAAHAWGITHRDVTPANVMLLPGDDVKLLDFGLAVHGRSAGAAGTVGYAAPEQARGESPTPRADVFSLGCVIYECLLGEKAFAAETDVGVIARMLEGDTARVTSRLTGVPSALVKLLARMLASDPELRPQGGAAVAAELAQLAGSTGGAAKTAERDFSSRSVTDAEARASQVLVAETTAAESPRLAAELDALGASVTRELPDPRREHQTRVVCVWSSDVSGVERAVRGARALLAVRRFDVHARASLVAATSDAAGLRAAIELLPDAPALHVDADTSRLLGDRFVVRPDAAGDLALLRENASPHSRNSLLGHETHCVGRDREIGLVVSTFDECKSEPDARVVWVTGAAGIGKTRVRDEVLSKVAREGARIWSAQPDPTRSGVALGVLADLVRSASSISRDDDEAHQRAALARVCEAVADGGRARVVEFLSELLELPVAEPSPQLRAAREEPTLMGDQMRRAFEDLVLADLGRAPLALVVEDLQWADAASVRAISDVARVARDRPLFVLLLGRPEAKDTHLRLVADRQPTGVALGKLGQKAMEKLVLEALAGSGAADPELASSLAQRAGGNPFFAEELVRAARAGGASQTSLAALAVLESRLTSLEPEARRVLRAGSVFGPHFSSADAAALLGDEVTIEFVDAWCAWLAEREVLAQSGGLWSFRHALVRDAAYAMLPEADRKTAHALAAEHLERAPRPLAPLIAEHFARAGEPHRAARWLATSAQSALEANDLTACIDLGERALRDLHAAGARADLLVVLFEAHRWRGDYDRSVAFAREALTILPEGCAGFFRALAELAAIAGSVGPPEEFESAIERLMNAPVDRGAEGAASIAWSRAAMQLAVRSDARAEDLLARAEAAADTDLSRGRVEQAFAVRAGIRGDLEQLVRRYRASVEALERAGDVRSACVQELNLASALCELGCDDDARERLEHGAREAEARGLSTAVALGRHLNGILLARAGRVDEALEAQRRALETFTAQGNARMEGGLRSHVAELLLRKGDRDRAVAEAVRATELLVGAAPARARALAVLAMVQAARADARAALDASAEALSIAETSGVESGESIVYAARARALRLAGSPDAAAVLELGKRKLAARAAAIADPNLRARFLKVPENADLADAP